LFNSGSAKIVFRQNFEDVVALQVELPSSVLHNFGAPLFESAGALLVLFVGSGLEVEAHGEKVDQLNDADQTEAHEKPEKSSGIAC